jgi:hypothetical protein
VNKPIITIKPTAWALSPGGKSNAKQYGNNGYDCGSCGCWCCGFLGFSWFGCCSVFWFCPLINPVSTPGYPKIVTKPPKCQRGMLTSEALRMISNRFSKQSDVILKFY